MARLVLFTALLLAPFAPVVLDIPATVRAFRKRGGAMSARR